MKSRLLLIPAATFVVSAFGRQTTLFNEAWTFVREQEPPRAVVLPHDWAVDYPFTKEVSGCEGRLPYFGRATYAKSFVLPPESEGKCVRLEIDGAMNHSSVWLNGREVSSERPYGYVSYAVDLTPALKKPGERNDLEIRLNTPNHSSRYYSGAGLYRDVRLVVLDRMHVAYDGVRIRTKPLPDGAAEVTVDFEVEGLPGVAGTLQYGGCVVRNGQAVESCSGEVVTPTGRQSMSVRFAMVVRNPELWSPESPAMYALRLDVRLRGSGCDMVRVPFGIRTVEFRPGKGFFLNGRHRQMKGACLHHDFGPLGGAFSVDAARRQLSIMKEMGADAIRTTHNPPDPKFLDLCDEMGFLVMDEAFDMWELGKTSKDYHNEFPVWHERDLEAFVKRDRNHPCVVLWSIGNEVQEHTEDPERGYRIGTNLTEIVSRHDERPTTVACWSPNAMTNGMQKTVFVFGSNYTPWWYESYIKDNPDRCIIGTETESTLSSRGTYFYPWPERPNNFWKDDPQPFYYAKGPDASGRWGVLTNVWNRLFRDGQVTGYDVAHYQAELNHPPDTQFMYQEKFPAVCGMFTWTGIDYLGEPTPYGGDDEKARSAYYGACDLCGFPKDRFYLFRAHWLPDRPTAHILPHWNWRELAKDCPGGLKIPVHVYASGDEAELFVNGKSQGVRRRGRYQYRFRWDEVTYEPGEVNVVVKKEGRHWATDVVRTSGKPARVLVEKDFEGDSLVYFRLKAVDKEGNFCPTAAIPLDLAAKGGELVGVCNGDATDWTPFKSHRITTFNGLAQAIVRKTGGLPVELSCTCTFPTK